MVREYRLPDVGEGVAEGEIVRWLVEPGDAVEEDQPIAEVETDKAMVDLPAPVDGSIRELHAEEGDIVPVGDVVVTFDIEGEDDTDATGGEPDDSDEETEIASDDGAEPAPGDSPDAGSEVPDGRVFASPSIRREARQAGVDIGEIEGSGPGGWITAADIQQAASSGEQASPAVPDESAVEEGAGAASEPSGPAPQQTVADTGTIGSDADSAAADRDRTLAAPATRRVAREEDVDLNAVPAVEQRDGEAFVTADAVREYAAAQQVAQEADAAAVTGAGSGTEAASGDTREPYRGVRRAIGEAMETAKYTAPHVTHHDTADVTELVATRKRLAAEAEERGIRLTYTPFVMKAVAVALNEHPILNAQLDEEAEEIVKRGEYNLGVATDTEAGLMVPVVEDVDHKGLLELASETNELAQKARERSIEPAELQGGTFTITNVGVIGGEYATPIINHPEVAILALGAIKERPRVHEGEVVPRETLPLSLSIDHRVVDGADAARFTNRVIELLEEPSLLLLE
ncbi:dihydrolipoamide acetyltransferase family protein [Natranaeroarchaeum sulfidigenes]|uniref:Pyruvate/2-oxoglutarate dehydrogenase complex, dihydrolipoamide acyltransferase (E2) component or related enzyme n=1 Tax=Natranaeroarchaeum sulfidigenes TaxID=2784880 RepID=A0A897MLQ2_9EURY|nr:dihydrolipoamide acetyltransferase family protein [Natranaeroarchaeum sulfidigenes]QSG01544.1 Pyruvate/2-oxoglutarate dehydrogenase complex, dihydrolipoamide acyltransferase (E2) component or related enzyme [Natranaeroarchaeum sulfidigenes]